MDISRKFNNRRNRSNDPLERRMDRWIETGRQFVDGVTGNRPGLRREVNLGMNRSSFDNVGRWVGDKLDWFFEEEDDWMESSKSIRNLENSLPNQKRPLQAVSLRVQKAISPSSLPDQVSDSSESWPDDSSFKLDRWKRPQIDEQMDSADNLLRDQRSRASSNRSLPKSRRRKD
ncbi:hypothetical protein [Prochlorococcus marinus]|uniref:Uncharacterized protein n=1 Tax=Prochlorococcus marinus (strain MIT 9211) TaxID=93059 RepID=A9BDC2_PROM4|nr:hypothetical protein [Prochlorococcus marinus]ABX09735.1 Conserved hypothetical protein [Prochlorococcus marinus str. MIT 9211]